MHQLVGTNTLQEQYQEQKYSVSAGCNDCMTDCGSTVHRCCFLLATSGVTALLPEMLSGVARVIADVAFSFATLAFQSFFVYLP